MGFNKQLPKWEGTTVEPPESKKEEGYIAGDRPPASWENWLRNLTYEALKELQERSEDKNNKGQADGYASLDSEGNVPENQLGNIDGMEVHGNEYHTEPFATQEALNSHLEDEANPHNTNSEQITLLGSSAYDPDSLPNEYPKGYTSFRSLATTSELDKWQNATSAPSVSTRKFLIETIITDHDSSFETTKQIVSHFSDDDLVGVYVRGSGDNAWGEFKLVWSKYGIEPAVHGNEAHSEEFAELSQVTSEKINLIDRTDYDVNTPASEFPKGYTAYRETRTSQIDEWETAMNAPTFGFRRYLIETLITDLKDDTFEVSRQRVTIIRGADDPEERRVIGVYERYARENEWGEFKEIFRDDGSHIVESGSNDDGYWVRYADGTQILHHRLIIKEEGDETPGVKSVVWSFALPFSSFEHFSLGHTIGSGRPDNRGRGTTVQLSTDSATLHYYEEAGTNDEVVTRAWAIGRWK